MTLLVQRSTSVLLMVLPVVVLTRLAGLRWRDLPGLAGVGAGDAAANGAFAWSSTLGLLSVTSVLGSLYPVATLAAGRGSCWGSGSPGCSSTASCSPWCGIVLLAAG